MDKEGGDWYEYQKLVLAELGRLDKWLEALDKRMGAIEIELAMLRVKAGMWGGLAGGLTGIGLLLAEILRK